MRVSYFFPLPGSPGKPGSRGMPPPKARQARQSRHGPAAQSRQPLGQTTLKLLG